jgi:hypothetical protein
MKELLLLDSLYRETFKRKEYASFREKLKVAHRFVLDDAMASFLSDLAHDSFLGPILKKSKVEEIMPDSSDPIVRMTGASEKLNTILKHDKTMPKLMEGIRQLARLPHQTVWIEFNNQLRMQRTKERYGGIVGAHWDVDADVIERSGWLLETIEDEVFKMTYVASNADDPPLIFPFSYYWTTSSLKSVEGYSFDFIGPDDGSISASGIYNYKSNKVTIGSNRLSLEYAQNLIADSAREIQSELRFAFSLLASINDIPVGIEEKVISKGFVAKGQYRKYLSHSVISLTVPKKRDVAKLSRILVAISRRKAHEVRGHFRRVGPQKIRKWIHEHTRGDPRLGWVIQSYQVNKGDN